jgi:hypothetical protein
MIDDKLLNKFDCIQDLPVSEEMLGAYIEGGLNDLEASEIHSYINSANTQISEIVESVLNINECLQEDVINEGYIDILELPNIGTFEVIDSIDTFYQLSNDTFLDHTTDMDSNTEYVSFQDLNENIIDNSSESIILDESTNDSFIQDIDDCFNDLNF